MSWSELEWGRESGFLNRLSEAKFTPGFPPGSTPVLVPISNLPGSYLVTTETPDLLEFPDD